MACLCRWVGSDHRFEPIGYGLIALFDSSHTISYIPVIFTYYPKLDDVRQTVMPEMARD